MTHKILVLLSKHQGRCDFALVFSVLLLLPIKNLDHTSSVHSKESIEHGLSCCFEQFSGGNCDPDNDSHHLSTDSNDSLNEAFTSQVALLGVSASPTKRSLRPHLRAPPQVVI